MMERMCLLVLYAAASILTVGHSMPLNRVRPPCPESCFKRDCSAILQSNSSALNGDYVIQPHDGREQFSVYCEMRDDGGWTMIQRREDGLVDFYHDWDTYKTGFGNVNSEFWLGNEHIHRLTSDGDYELLVEITDAGGAQKFAKYTHFRIGSEWANYTLRIAGYTGTAGDALVYHNGKAFSTYERDNDASTSHNCALNSNAGWWYNACYRSSLNGPYMTPGTIPATHTNKGIIWNNFRGLKYSHKLVQMMIRRPN